MSKANHTIRPERITISPYLKIGWGTVLDQMDQQVNMQLSVLGLRLPLKRRFTFTQVVHVNKVFRQAWWSHGLFGMASSLNPLEIIRTLWEIQDIGKTHVPIRGFRYDILVVIQGGKSIKLGTVKSPEVANQIERECRLRFRLSEI